MPVLVTSSLLTFINASILLTIPVPFQKWIYFYSLPRDGISNPVLCKADRVSTVVFISPSDLDICASHFHELVEPSIRVDYISLEMTVNPHGMRMFSGITNDSLLFIGSTGSENIDVHYHMSWTTDHAVTLDLRLFASRPVEPVGISAYCASLTNIFERAHIKGTAIPFTVTSGHGRNHINSLLLLDSCGIHPPRIHLWGLSEALLQAPESYCTIDSIIGDEHTRQAWVGVAIHPICIEDVFQLGLSARRFARRGAHVVLLSSIGVSSIVRNGCRASMSLSGAVSEEELGYACDYGLEEAARTEFMELFAILKATQDPSLHGLHLMILSPMRSLPLKGLDLDGEKSDPFPTSRVPVLSPTGIIDVLLNVVSMSAEGDPEERMMTALSRLQDFLLASLDGREGDGRGITSLTLLNYALLEHVVDVDGIKHCPPPSPHSLPSSYLCDHHLARLLVSGALRGIASRALAVGAQVESPACTKAISIPQGNSSESQPQFTCIGEGKRLGSLTYPSPIELLEAIAAIIKGGVGVGTVGTDAPPSRIPAPSVSVADGEVHVLLFVLPHQLPFAQRKVQQWREGCDVKTCQIYVRYSIEMLPRGLSGPGYDHKCLDMATEASRRTCEAVWAMPSLRAAHLAAWEYTEAVAAVNDLVVLLVGVGAIASFPQPGKLRSSLGLIPAVEYGKNARYRLPSEVVIGFETERKEVSLRKYCGNGSPWSFRSVAGTGSALRRMWREAREDPVHLVADAGVACAMARYAAAHPTVVTIDVESRVFQMGQAHGRIRSALKYCAGHEQIPKKTMSAVCSVEGVPATLFSNDGDALDESEEESVTAVYAASMLRVSSIVNERGDISEDTMEEASRLIRLAAGGGQWTKGVKLVLSLHDGLSRIRDQPGCDFYDQFLTLKLFEVSKNSRFVNYMTSLKDFKVAASLLERSASIQWCECVLPSANDGHAENYSQVDNRDNGFNFCAAMHAAAASIYQEIGPHDNVMSSTYASLLPVLHTGVERSRAKWVEQKLKLRCDPLGFAPSSSSSTSMGMQTCRLVTHFLTVASHETAGLANLRLSATLAGIDLKVLGLNDIYVDYADKLRLINGHLSSPDSAIDDNDVVVVVDAFDVLLFPAIRRIGQFLSSSPTPIVFCAEHGHYPEFPAAYLYHRGFYNFGTQSSELFSDDIASPRFLNSGCIVGRAEQMRAMFLAAHSRGQSFRDDQQMFVRYALMHPEEVTLDTANKHMLTGHLERVGTHSHSVESNAIELHVSVTADLKFSLRRGGRVMDGIGILHCNNINASSLYHVVVSLIGERVREHYLGADGMQLLTALHHCIDGNMEGVERTLRAPVVQRNQSSIGGANSLADLLAHCL